MLESQRLGAKLGEQRRFSLGVALHVQGLGTIALSRIVLNGARRKPLAWHRAVGARASIASGEGQPAEPGCRRVRPRQRLPSLFSARLEPGELRRVPLGGRVAMAGRCESIVDRRQQRAHPGEVVAGDRQDPEGGAGPRGRLRHPLVQLVATGDVSWALIASARARTARPRRRGSPGAELAQDVPDVVLTVPC